MKTACRSLDERPRTKFTRVNDFQALGCAFAQLLLRPQLPKRDDDPERAKTSFWGAAQRLEERQRRANCDGMPVAAVPGAILRDAVLRICSSWPEGLHQSISLFSDLFACEPLDRANRQTT